MILLTASMVTYIFAATKSELLIEGQIGYVREKGTGTEEDPFLIYSVGANDETAVQGSFNYYAGKNKEGINYFSSTSPQYYFKQVGNISGSNFTQTNLLGFYDGNGYTFTASGGGGALFNSVGSATNSTAKLENLKVYNSDSTAAAGVVIDVYGTIERVTFDGNITNATSSAFVGGIASRAYASSEIKACYNSANVEGSGSYSYVGGIVGYIGDTSKIEECCNTGKIYARLYGKVGGIAGYLYGTSTNQKASIFSCYNAGKVTLYTLSSSNGYGGGIAGYIKYAQIYYCYNIGTVERTNMGSVGAIAGLVAGTITNSYWIAESGSYCYSSSQSGVSISNTKRLNNEEKQYKNNWSNFLFGTAGTETSGWVFVYEKEMLINGVGKTVSLPRLWWEVYGEPTYNVSFDLEGGLIPAPISISDAGGEYSFVGGPNRYYAENSGENNGYTSAKCRVDFHAIAGTTVVFAVEHVCYNSSSQALFSELNSEISEGGGFDYEWSDYIETDISYPIAETGDYYIYIEWQVYDCYGMEWNEEIQDYEYTDGYTELYFSLKSGNVGYDTSTIKVLANTAIGDLPAPQKDNYALYGWYTEPNGAGIEVTGKTKIDRNYTFYAHWVPSDTTYTVTAVKHNLSTVGDYTFSISGSGTAKVTGTNINFSFGCDESANYKFIGWYSSADSINSEYLVSTEKSFIQKVSRQTAYYAYFKVVCACCGIDIDSGYLCESECSIDFCSVCSTCSYHTEICYSCGCCIDHCECYSDCCSYNETCPACGYCTECHDYQEPWTCEECGCSLTCSFGPGWTYEEIESLGYFDDPRVWCGDCNPV